MMSLVGPPVLTAEEEIYKFIDCDNITELKKIYDEASPKEIREKLIASGLKYAMSEFNLNVVDFYVRSVHVSMKMLTTAVVADPTGFLDTYIKEVALQVYYEDTALRAIEQEQPELLKWSLSKICACSRVTKEFANLVQTVFTARKHSYTDVNAISHIIRRYVS